MIASSWNEFLLEKWVLLPVRFPNFLSTAYDAKVFLRFRPGRGAVGVDCIPTADGANLRGGEGAEGEAKRSPEAAIGEAAAARMGGIYGAEV